MSGARRVAARMLVVAVSVAATASCAEGTPHLEHAWARAGGLRGGSGAVYLDVVNDASSPFEVTGVRVPDTIARAAELHRGSVDASGMARMRRVGTMHVDAGARLTFQPGGNHIMLVGLRHALRAGTTFSMQLLRRGSVPLTTPVRVRAG